MAERATGPVVDPAKVAAAYRYESLTWPEINVAVAQEKVIVIPVGSIEQHGWHLPIDVDVRTATEICLGAGAANPATTLVMPPVSYGYCHHVMDFPGTINVQPTTFINLLIEIGISVAYHGFKRIVMVNGHGSNHHLVEQAARQVNLQTDALCASVSWWHLSAPRWNAEWRQSGPGGCAHACELETAIYLHMDAEGVRQSQIRGAVATSVTDIPGGAEWTMIDVTGPSGPAAVVEWTSTYSETGSIGTPELGDAERGKLVFDHTVERLAAFVAWFQTRPRPERVSHHATAPTFPLPFGF